MSFIPRNTEGSARIIFNSGSLDFGTFGVVNLENVAIEPSVAEAPLRKLNSIKMAALKRKTFQVSLRGKVKSFNKEVLTDFFGESASDGTGTMITFKDGQQPELNPIFTAFVGDDTNQPFQCQFIDAIIRSMPITAALEEYGEIDFEMIARDVKIYTEE